MCGIFGIASCGGASLKRASEAIKRFCLLSESRGKDASGLVFQDDSSIHVVKRPVRARMLLDSPEFIPLAHKIDRAATQSQPFFVMGHTRMVTNGNSDNHENNQPVIKEGLVCIHNGIVTNEDALWQRYGELQRLFEVDTEVIVSLVDLFRRRGDALPTAAASAFAELEGANSIALAASDFRGAILATSNGSLFFASGAGVIAFASEKYILEKTIESSTLRSFLDSAEIHQLKPGWGCVIAIDSERLEVASFLQREKPPLLSANPKVAPRKIFDDVPLSAQKAKKVPFLAGTSYKELEKLCKIDTEKIDALRRCSRCLLPETFPFITFDSEGVCNYCAKYSPWQSKGLEALEELVVPMRKPGGEPDCLVPVSGGRDSSYALHIVKNVLKMNPVAYTYDWGMVTDLARRNISRMCGALGVEHILVSADIAQKRANVRKNVLAWLKKPHLGTVTLFMAGDKPFFYYARMLRKQMNLGAAIFGMNDLERTDFKVGFCGIDETVRRKRFYNLRGVNKLKMMLFFGMQFLNNRAYMNSTLLDSFKGFASYYLIPQDFIPLFDYVRWDEKAITDTLLEGYGWEVAGDTRTTWRIGDGTASFYNYIYYRSAGFSEHDTFRSNQIREGMIKRDDALRTISEENRPRVESIKWYCDTIGIDAVEAVQCINNQLHPLYA